MSSGAVATIALDRPNLRNEVRARAVNFETDVTDSVHASVERRELDFTGEWAVR